MKIIQQVKKIIAENIESNAFIENETDLRKELDIDSFDVLMIMNDIDDEFSIVLEENDFQNVNTPQEIVTLLNEKYGVK